MVHRKGIALVKMHFIQMWPHTLFNKYQIWRFFLNTSEGHWKHCGRPHAAHGPVVGPHCFR